MVSSRSLLLSCLYFHSRPPPPTMPHVPALSPPLPSLLQDPAHTRGLRRVLTGSPGDPWGPGKPRGPGGPSFPRGPSGPRSPCRSTEEEGQAPRGVSPPVCEPALPCGASSEPSMGPLRGLWGPSARSPTGRVSPWPPLCPPVLGDLVHQEGREGRAGPSRPEALLLLSFPGEEEGAS